MAVPYKSTRLANYVHTYAITRSPVQSYPVKFKYWNKTYKHGSNVNDSNTSLIKYTSLSLSKKNHLSMKYLFQ